MQETVAAHLIVNPNTPEAWRQDLAPGEYIIGRGAENQVCLDHPSVSPAHCSLTVSDGVATLRDLGSETGTLVDGQPAQEVTLNPGTRFRVGEVELQYMAAIRVPVTVAGGQSEVASGAGNTSCKYHPRAIARYWCPKCAKAYCELCVETRAGSGRPQRICRKCGGTCQYIKVAPPSEEERPVFWKLLPGTLAYPFRGYGIFLLFAGGLFYTFLSWFPLLGFIMTGYMFNYAKQIVATSAAGEQAPPDWPDFTDWADTILLPYFHLAALVALTFGPALLLATFLTLEGWQGIVVVGGAIFLGGFLAPMGMLALAMFDTVTALNPVALVWSILRLPGQYVIAALTFEFAIGVSLFSEDLVKLVLPVPVLPYIISGFVSLYFIAVAMRIIGLHYWCGRHELGWFGR